MSGPLPSTGGPSNRRQTVLSLVAVGVALAVLGGLATVGGVGGDTVGVASGQPPAADAFPLATGSDLALATRQVQAECTLSDYDAPPGTSITLYAFDSQDADEFRYDKQGDGTFEFGPTTDAFHSFTYEESGTYTPTIEAYNRSTERIDSASCGTLEIGPNRDPDADLTYSPSSPDVGEEMTFDPSGTTDPDEDEIYDWRYDWNDDGTYDDFAETPNPMTHTYTERGSKTVTLRVEDQHGGVDTTSVTFFVGRRQPTARCTVSSEAVMVGEEVGIDASDSEHARTADFDVDGDGDYEYPGQEDLDVTHTYEEAGTYEVVVLVKNGDLTDRTTCGVVTVTDNEPPTADLSHSPQNPRAGQSVTFDASNSTDPDGTIRAYWWDFQGDGTVDLYTNVSEASYQYDQADSYGPTVQVVDDDGAKGTASQDLRVGQALPPPTTLCSIEDTTVTVGESTTVDASRSDGPDVVEFDVNGDEVYDRTDSDDFVIRVSYDEPGEYTVYARGTNDGGSDTVECGTVTVRDPGTEVPLTEPRTFTENVRTTTVPGFEEETPRTFTESVRTTTVPGGNEERPGTETDESDPGGFIPEVPDDAVPIIGGLLGLAGLGGAAYYLRPSGGGGGGGGTSAPPKPPSAPPSSKSAMYETGTFLTPPQSGPVSVTGLGFEPDLVVFTTTTNVQPGDDAPPDRSDGWSHGRAIRGLDGSIPQTSVTLTDDTRNLDAAMGASSDGHAVEVAVHNDAPPERVTGQVTELTGDGFEMAFDVDGLRGERAGDQYVVHYQAFSLGGNKVEVGHFRTPAYPGSQSVPLEIDADHVVLTATNTLATVDDRRMTDLPIGFSHGEVVGRQSPGQIVRNATVEPAWPGGTVQAAFDDRALHLVYGYEGDVRGRTTARVTGLGDSIDLEYEKVYSGPAKVGSSESKLVTYVAVETRDLQPTIGYFQLPDPGSDDLLHVDLGFEPRLVEFTTLGVNEMNTERVSRASPLGFGWSHGSVIGGRDGDDGIRHYLLNDAVDPERSTYEPHASPRHEGVAATVRSLADGGRVAGRDELTVTGFTDTGFQVTVTDVSSGYRRDDPQPFVFYKAWPNPEKGSEGANTRGGGGSTGGGTAAGGSGQH